jgi:hypothetical protein
MTCITRVADSCLNHKSYDVRASVLSIFRALRLACIERRVNKRGERGMNRDLIHERGARLLKVGTFLREIQRSW